ncbi:5-hydroxytryptamine receptor 1-like [Paramuricea clavata]|uniref:5-hydroxytryptamine receptor 1-like n=1 Tax=Paramuricea clavata TaxID=317549 RepID=A0A6S7KTI7_PARCT|nr:5-hydroxytryptamine receptor 1-like [Paramuricea clavata]
MSSYDTSAMYNQTNQTGTWANSDWIKYLEFREQLSLAKTITIAFSAILTILGNTLVLVATWRDRSLHQPNKYFIACLAVADLLVGMVVAPLNAYQHFKPARTMSIHLCRFAVWADTFALTASIYSLTFISFDRYLKISKPLKYKSRMTTSTSLKVIFIIWLISTGISTYAATPQSGSNGILTTAFGFCTADRNKRKAFYTFVEVSAFFLPTVVILAMYALIFLVVRKRQKMLRNGELGQSCGVPNQRCAFLRDLKAIRMLLVVVGVFILCWSPFFIFNVLHLYFPNIVDWRSRSLNYLCSISITAAVITLLPLLNSLCNPIIYACLDNIYREAFKNLFQRLMCRTSSRTRPTPLGIELRPPRPR